MDNKKISLLRAKTKIELDIAKLRSEAIEKEMKRLQLEHDPRSPSLNLVDKQIIELDHKIEEKIKEREAMETGNPGSSGYDS